MLPLGLDLMELELKELQDTLEQRETLQRQLQRRTHSNWRKMINNDEKIMIINSKINALEYNIRDNRIQIEDISKIEPLDEETIDALNGHIERTILQKQAMENELAALTIDQ